MAAFRALLDEEHAPLPKVGNDDNAYILGRMGRHNVVMAFPSAYGTNPATQTVTNMIRSFPNIRFGLLVGIGGGAPQPINPDPRKDIRLTDVVVSSPEKELSGVIQWDMGTLEESGPAWKPLDIPEQIMTSYFNQVTSTRMETPVWAAIHPKLLREQKRESTRAEVHYGQIASGNMVMRNAKKRDTLRKMWRVICLEMEAAGLMDNFPCTVIRGICDYSDSHKNKQWQAYAALTAAAYAKDLLMTVQPEEVELTPPANDIMNGERLRHWDGIGPPPPGKGDGGGGGSGGSGEGAGGGGNWSVPPRFRLPPVQSLWAAIRDRNIRRIRLLLRMGVNPNIRDHRNGRNSLHKAAYWNRPTAARILIPYMNNINAEDDKGLTALDVAKKRGHGAVARVLRNHGAS
ncbi:hypothetical protein TrVGV298_006246 [Trichoderma virens]|nr:hypothetical protein TrVGV298_006246 [Trichoderma virens]